MIASFDATLHSLSIHNPGNKILDEKYRLSATPFEIKEQPLNKLLLQYFLSPFEKVPEIYRLSHASDNELNEIFHFAGIIFDNPEKLHESSQEITKHLHNVSNHPKIKPGELYVVYFENVQVEGELHNAIGIFKSESKESYLKVFSEENG
jgi:hypothetical protein